MTALTRRKVLSGMAVACATPCVPGIAAPLVVETWFAPKAELWDRWTRRDDRLTTRVDHGLWDWFLGKFRRLAADGIARIDYRNVSGPDKARLEDYLIVLRDTEVSRLAAPEQRAFWINLYNALTVKIVLDRYPVASIRDIAFGGLFEHGPWERKLFRVEGVPISLNDIEHRILRPIWRDARIHYVVNCASLGCPNLGERSFNADDAEATLEEAARNYINHSRGARPVADGLILSKIYGWFASDFGATDAAVVDHLRRYAHGGLGVRIEANPRIADYVYDWRLNDVDA
jgi:hypothetical protein